MKTNIPERLAALREAMKQQKIDAYIIPTSDPHMSEYPAACWKYGNGFPVSPVPLERLSLQPIKQAYGPTRAISCRLVSNWRIPALTCTN